MGKWIGGKGSDRRPKKVSDEQFQDNWERIFGNKNPISNQQVRLH